MINTLPLSVELDRRSRESRLHDVCMQLGQALDLYAKASEVANGRYLEPYRTALKDGSGLLLEIYSEKIRNLMEEMRNEPGNI